MRRPAQRCCTSAAATSSKTLPVTKQAEGSGAATHLLHAQHGQDAAPRVLDSPLEVESLTAQTGACNDNEARNCEAPSVAEAEGETDPLMEEHRDLQKAFVRSKADRPVVPICHDDSVVIFLLTRCCNEVLHALRDSSALGEARKRVEEAGCSLFANDTWGIFVGAIDGQAIVGAWAETREMPHCSSSL